MTLEEKIEQIRKLKEALHPLLNEVLIENMEEIFKLNQEQLNERGEWANSKKITPPYKPRTVELKDAKNQPTDRVTLYDTGDFQGAFFLEVKEKSVEVNSDDWKTPKLTTKYTKGGQFFGLTKDSISKLREIIREPYLNKIREFYARG